MVMFWRNFSIFLTTLSLGGIVISINTESYDMVYVFIVLAAMQAAITYTFHKNGL